MASEQQQIPSVNKPSGIPRVSKLPVLTNKHSQASLQSAGEPSKSITASTKVQKPPAFPSFSRPGQPASKTRVAVGKHSTSRSSLSNGSNHVSRSSISTSGSRLPGVKPSSHANVQALRPTSANTTRILENQENQENEETEDGPSSLDGLRAATRRDFYEELPTEPKESIKNSDLSQTQGKTRSSRPSLSDRTIESIQRLPATPKERRRSSFFSPVVSPMGPPPRPSSSLSRNGSNGSSRPSTIDGGIAVGRASPVTRRIPASAKPLARSSIGGLEPTPGHTHSISTSTDLRHATQGNKNAIPHSPRSSLLSTPVAAVIRLKGPQIVRGTPASRMVTARDTNPRRSLSDAFGPAVREATTERSKPENRHSHYQASEPKTSMPATANPSKASSAALRQQIAAAKAAARKDKSQDDPPRSAYMARGDSFEMNLQSDPFGQAPKDNKHVLRNKIKSARMDGKLNIAALQLKRIPDEVMEMYSATAIEQSAVSWAEIVDLTRLIAADNEIEEFEETVFPDKSAEDFDLDDQTEGNQFGGLDFLDLHNNRLRALPIGLRRLERLTTLNLTHNKLENSVLDVISQITSLKAVRLGYNALSGTLPASISNLHRLETLNLQSNRLLGLPEALRELVCLRVLNVSSNQLTALPMGALQELPLTDLDASNNALIASLFPVGGLGGHLTIQNLKVANNSLAALTFDIDLELPMLLALDVSNNHLTSLPLISACTELITLAAGDNKIVELPAGFTSLRKLRNANFSSNELRLLDNEIANMESLESLVLASNPLREKKFLTMGTADVKRDLKTRLAPVEAGEEGPGRDVQGEFRDMTSPNSLSPTSSWVLKPNGLLDLAGRGYSDGINDSIGSFFRSNEVNRLNIQMNMLTAVPPALWLGQDLRVLNLSGNPLSSDYLSDELELPSLQELDLSGCGLRTLEPLISQLGAANLQMLNVTANRLSGALPTLRKPYSSLKTLLAGDNGFTSVTADSLHGFHTVNLASNSIEQLPAEVGLLWDEGLRNLEIGSNAFRVPNYRVLEKGTEATMRWLKDRLPASHGMAVVNIS